jgi:hypothetical protein
MQDASKNKASKLVLSAGPNGISGLQDLSPRASSPPRDLMEPVGSEIFHHVRQVLGLVRSAMLRPAPHSSLPPWWRPGRVMQIDTVLAVRGSRNSALERFCLVHDSPFASTIHDISQYGAVIFPHRDRSLTHVSFPSGSCLWLAKTRRSNVVVGDISITSSSQTLTSYNPSSKITVHTPPT